MKRTILLLVAGSGLLISLIWYMDAHAQLVLEPIAMQEKGTVTHTILNSAKLVEIPSNAGEIHTYLDVENNNLCYILSNISISCIKR